MVRHSGLSVWARVISAWRVPAAIVSAVILFDLGFVFAYSCSLPSGVCWWSI
jgi:hypothetical protein